MSYTEVVQLLSNQMVPKHELYSNNQTIKLVPILEKFFNHNSGMSNLSYERFIPDDLSEQY